MMRNIEKYIKTYLQYLEQKGALFNSILGFVFSVLFGVLDIVSPIQYSFILLYIFPIALTTWFGGQAAGIIVSLFCTAFWTYTYTQVDILSLIWNVISTLIIFITISIMLNKIRSMWENDIVLSRTDQLTGAMNRRSFDEIVEYEILRLQRQNSPFSLAYLDMDNFKSINDCFGHKRGDELLTAVVACISANLRRTDVVARIGGDEFTIFFPATDQHAVKLVMLKLNEQLRLLSERNNWPTTFSIGVITCTDAQCDLERLISLADKLMYEVKRSGKNDVQYLTYSA